MTSPTDICSPFFVINYVYWYILGNKWFHPLQGICACTWHNFILYFFHSPKHPAFSSLFTKAVSIFPSLFAICFCFLFLSFLFYHSYFFFFFPFEHFLPMSLYPLCILFLLIMDSSTTGRKKLGMRVGEEEHGLEHAEMFSFHANIAFLSVTHFILSESITCLCFLLLKCHNQGAYQY